MVKSIPITDKIKTVQIWRHVRKTSKRFIKHCTGEHCYGAAMQILFFAGTGIAVTRKPRCMPASSSLTKFYWRDFHESRETKRKVQVNNKCLRIFQREQLFIMNVVSVLLILL